MWHKLLFNILLVIQNGLNPSQSPDEWTRVHHSLPPQSVKDAEAARYHHESRLSQYYRPSPLAQIQEGAPLSDFIPYGSNTEDSALPTEDDSFIEVKLAGTPFTFFNKTYSSLFLNTNGGASFGKGTATYNPVCGTMDLPMIAPYWTDVDTRKGGVVNYRQTTKGSDLSKIKDIVNRAFPSTVGILDIEWAFVVTWDKVAFFGAATPSDNCPGSSLRNTLQGIFVQEKQNSYVIFLYNNLVWTVGTGTFQKGDACIGRNPTVGKPAKAGFDYGDGKTFFFLPGSCTEGITDIAQKSNFLENGKWAFKVTDGVTTTCDVSCKGGEPFQIDPYNCSTYYECSNGVPIKMICPKSPEGGRLVFNPKKNVCVWPREYDCKPICHN